MDKNNELFTKLKKKIDSEKLQQILQELNDANKDKETETAVSFIEEISPPSSFKEHGNSNNSSNNNNNNPELYLNDYYQLFLNQAESPLPPLPPPPPSPSPPPPVPVRYYHHQPLPPLQPRKDFHTNTTSLLNSPLTTIAAMPTTFTSIAAAATSPRVSSPIDLTFIAPKLSPLPPSPPPPPPPPPPSPTPAPAAYKTTTTVSSSPRKNSHPKKISPPKPKKFGIGKNMSLYKRLYDNTSSDNDNDDESDESSSTQQRVKSIG